MDKVPGRVALGQLSLLLLMFLSLLLLLFELFQPSRGGKVTALAEERENKTKTILLCFMVIAVRKRVYSVEREGW